MQLQGGYRTYVRVYIFFLLQNFTLIAQNEPVTYTLKSSSNFTFAFSQKMWTYLFIRRSNRKMDILPLSFKRMRSV